MIAKRGDMVQTYGCGDRPNLLYGLVVKAGSRQFEVLWESDHRTRYMQDSHQVRSFDNVGDPEFEAQIRGKLEAAARASGCYPART